MLASAGRIASALGRVAASGSSAGSRSNKVELGAIDQITSSVEVGHGSLVLAADVLVNSLLHHLEGQASAAGGLNSPAAVEGHPLQKLFFGISDNDISDALFEVTEEPEGGDA